MEYPNPKIKYYKVRTFNEKMNTAFDFLRENWKSLLKFSFYLILPICLLQSFSMNAAMKHYFNLGFNLGSGGTDFDIFSVLLNYAIYMVFILLGTSLLNALVYTLMIEYERRDSRLAVISVQDIKRSLIKNSVKILRVYLLLMGFFLLIGALVVGLAMLSPWTLILTVLIFLIVMVVFMIPLNLIMPIYIFEDISFSTAFRKSFKYGFSGWGQTFLILLVFGLLANIVSGVTTMPWYLVMLFGQIFSITEQGAGINAAIWYQFIMYLLGIIQSYGTYVSLIISAVGIAFQYFHLREKNEGISVYTNIQNFDRL